ncbi:GNAT family N-acetyltransferase [Paracidovorax avenae]|uniref:GNAT family N-acetyltransferase n=1 Tax=Paracidovorax avenae TaxID=80867 RepID=UPI000D157DB9|nr:GNAT family N-acetyltransferase [Paracidovorax avenae]AVS69522.1 GNAT family N-acetyltransferase [Paracidovorax avenae]AVS80252.1 GNAT family N-acetyltransferase [Paracidovorax avenae]AVS84028.1 GNAT family N-acetyltransferase [Paracidovorax avenae]AVS92196.1 GNAT family N-acetyltransferase [Paracidovorax avenae]AVS98009.1 GNAT family N-acetyltransferase [Paracidovorax avenae]
MTISIRPATVSDLDAIAEVWEASVRASHHFLPVSEIEALRPVLREQYLPAVDLQVAVGADGGIAGFIGTAAGKIEMLFIAPAARGSGIGSALMARTDAPEVDVNEQNTQALDFYRRRGFQVVGRSPLDGQGRPYPLLHLRR